ncbi:MAG: SidJ-related pseudokinase [Desulfococcaceae bacterium]
MSGWNPATELERHEAILNCRPLSFSAAFVVVGNLRDLIEAHPEIALPRTVDTLGGIISGTDFIRKRQAFFLYKAAAEALVVIAKQTLPSGLSAEALARLQQVVRTGAGPAHRASAEALGSLPVSITGPAFDPPPAKPIPRIGWKGILQRAGITVSEVPVLMGRSLVAPVEGSDSILVVKFSKTRDGIPGLNAEAAWADRLRTLGNRFSYRFDIPKPIQIQGRYLFQLNTVWTPISRSDIGGGPVWAIALLAHRDYFGYPNDHRKGRGLDFTEFKGVMNRVAGLMGEMTSMGILHSAPIPLFHNRIQQHRRNDGGIYDWRRGGRLDQWLFSCRYPNFGLTGLRDLEHLESFTGAGSGIYSQIGAQLLSLLLVAGSYFRNRAPERFGFSASGVPVDTRDLFDRRSLLDLVQGIFQSFFTGFTGEADTNMSPEELNDLVDRMIEEMGVDTHMEEILRIPDQEAMSEAEFRDHLASRGLTREAAAAFTKGKQEISLQTGPHLGGFNQRISLPELIRFLETAAALCIARRFEKEQADVPLPRYGT